MDWGFSWLLSFVNQFWDVIVQVVTWLVHGILYTIKAGLWFAFDGLLTAFSTIINAISLGNLATSLAGSWGLLPGQVLFLLNACHISDGLSLIAVAIAVRMALNLIPAAFTRI